MGRLAGKVAFITGAGREQGRRHAVRLAEEGADIIAVDAAAPAGIDPSPSAPGGLAETARLVERAGRRVVAVRADVRDAAALTAAVDQGVAELGRLDIVLADAGTVDPLAVLEEAEQTWQHAIDGRLIGVWRIIKASVPHLMSGGRGGSVVITTPPATPLTAGRSAGRSDGRAPHGGTAQAWLIPLIQVLAEELDPYGVRVNAVHHETAADDGVLGGPVSPALTRMPVETPDPDDITNAVMYLVSDDGCYVSGTMHVVGARDDRWAAGPRMADAQTAGC
ncbi:SDR family oxidoreductase [Streptomyces sp. NPDC057621]|uniref:SDR family oxidoreductase n=1 Tax=Streptomyces sp. NPDC057621 TaxID=3346186 RepID=UPI00369B446C